ncbi:hypothetical protein Esi_0159_0011 [Ectocarpus siliculosus]|uniref:Uncharacterized protein n=1 Tax=Ectocarpus siliculosus TaxID=2880 RepID=D7FLC3_ECTSI|nr:hypothetical protein Esi_0159_0011 [Ectocarpus siliculosus]|eukprot:CBJ29691.1 hypothetical protein Esi_0159_0011 [Ectocarpus siliculosus]
MKWKVRPDVVLRGRHENKSKGALSAFWQDYKKVRVDWRARAGMRRDHFELALQHYMRIDGPSRDTCEGRIRYIWETRIRDNSHLGVVDVSCQPAKAKEETLACQASNSRPHPARALPDSSLTAAAPVAL